MVQIAAYFEVLYPLFFLRVFSGSGYLNSKSQENPVINERSATARTDLRLRVFFHAQWHEMPLGPWLFSLPELRPVKGLRPLRGAHFARP